MLIPGGLGASEYAGYGGQRGWFGYRWSRRVGPHGLASSCGQMTSAHTMGVAGLKALWAGSAASYPSAGPSALQVANEERETSDDQIDCCCLCSGLGVHSTGFATRSRSAGG